MLKGKIEISVDKKNCRMLLINKKIKVFGGFKNDLLNFGLINEVLLKEETIQEVNNEKIEIIIIGEVGENPIGEVVMGVLSRINYLKDCSLLHLEIYAKEEFDLQSISLIEDPIKEYLDLNLKIKIFNKSKEQLEYFICKGYK